MDVQICRSAVVLTLSFVISVWRGQLRARSVYSLRPATRFAPHPRLLQTPCHPRVLIRPTASHWLYGAWHTSHRHFACFSASRAFRWPGHCTDTNSDRANPSTHTPRRDRQAMISTKDRARGSKSRSTGGAHDSISSNTDSHGVHAVKGSVGNGAPSQLSEPRCHVERVLRLPNTLVVLHLSSTSPMMTLDLCCRPPHAPTELVIKGFAREAREPAYKTLDRMRLLFAPKTLSTQHVGDEAQDSADASSTSSTAHTTAATTTKPALDTQAVRQKAAKRTTFISKEAQLALCPPVVVRGVLHTDGSTHRAGTPSSDAPTEQTRTNEEDRDDDAEENGWVVLDAALTNDLFWSCARVLYIGNVRVKVRYNVPTIVALTPPSRPFVNVPLVCSDVETAFTTQAEVEYAWYVVPRGGVHGGGGAAGTTSARGTVRSDCSDEKAWVLYANVPAFVPTADLLGQTLVLRVRANVRAEVWAQVVLPPVAQPPPALARSAETASDATPPALRVTTYNILHDDFCTSRASREKIYPFASEAVLNLRNRQVRIVQELLAYHSDVVCLQECGKRLFQGYLLPTLRVCGYDGVYANKTGHVQEGCGFFFRTSRYELRATHTVALNWHTLHGSHAALAQQMSEHKELVEALTNVTSIGTAHVLRDRITGTELVVGNTHLFYHPNACHIRILQLYMLLHRIRCIAMCADVTTPFSAACETEEREGGGLRPIILCGDFNFTHRTGAYQLATGGRVGCDHPSWEKGKQFWWGCDRLLGCAESEMAATATPEAAESSASPARQNVTTHTGEDGPCQPETAVSQKGAMPQLERCFCADLPNLLCLTDAYGLMDPALPWTNYTMSFREVIDYIFVSTPNVRVLRTIPIPPESELAANFALPNANYPSDHVALVADVAIDCSTS